MTKQELDRRDFLKGAVVGGAAAAGGTAAIATPEIAQAQQARRGTAARRSRPDTPFSISTRPPSSRRWSIT